MFVQEPLLDTWIVHVSSRQMLSQEQVDKAHVIDLTWCEMQVFQHVRMSTDDVDAIYIKLLALIDIDFQGA